MEAIWVYGGPSNEITLCDKETGWLPDQPEGPRVTADLNAMAANATAAPGNVTPNAGSQLNTDAAYLQDEMNPAGLPGAMPIDNSDFVSAINDFGQAGTAYQSGDKSGANADLQAGTTALKAVLAAINADGCQPPDGGTS